MDRYQQNLIERSGAKNTGNGRMTVQEQRYEDRVNLSTCSDSRAAAQRKTRSFKNRESSSLGRRNNVASGQMTVQQANNSIVQHHQSHNEPKVR